VDNSTQALGTVDLRLFQICNLTAKIKEKMQRFCTLFLYIMVGDKLIKQTNYIDDKTGEIYKSNDKYVDMQFDEEKGYLFWNRKKHNKTFHDVKFPKEINWNEKGRLLELSQHVWSNTNLLAYRGNGGIKPYDEKQISKVIGLKERQTKAFIKKMIKNRIIAKTKIETGNRIEIHYYMNPIYFFSGNRIPLNLYLIFRNELDAILPEWVKEKYNEINRKNPCISAGKTLSVLD